MSRYKPCFPRPLQPPEAHTLRGVVAELRQHSSAPSMVRITEPGMQRLGDLLPCHLYMADVEWHTPGAVLRPDSGVPVEAAPPAVARRDMRVDEAVTFGLCMAWLLYLSLKMMGAA